MIAAETELELRRVRAVRLSLLTAGRTADCTALDSEHEAHVSTTMILNLSSLDCYEQRALSRRNRALQLLEDWLGSTPLAIQVAICLGSDPLDSQTRWQ